MEFATAQRLDDLNLRDDVDRPPNTIVDDSDGMRVVWHDMLPLLDKAAEEMTLGDLLHGEAFNLQEAMSALEMGDPQMDSMASNEPEPPPPAPLPDTILPADLIGVLDDVLCCEQAWYRSFPLAHSLFRLDWIHVADEISPPELRAPLLAAVKAAAAVRAIVLRGDVSDEEDFVANIYGLNLQEGISEIDVAKMLNEVEAATQVGIREAKEELEQAARDAGTDNLLQVSHVPGGVNSARLEGVLCRLRFRRAMVVTLCALLKPTPKTAEVARKMISFALTQIAPMRASLAMGTPREELSCFAGRTSRKLLGAAPQRALELMSRDEALKQTEAMLVRLKGVVGVADVTDYDGMTGWLQNLVGPPDVDLLTRSCCQLLGVAEDRGGPKLRAPIAPMVWEAVRVFTGLPQVRPPPPRPPQTHPAPAPADPLPHTSSSPTTTTSPRLAPASHAPPRPPLAIPTPQSVSRAPPPGALTARRRSQDIWKQIGETEEAAELQHQLGQAALVRMRLSCLNRARHRRRLRHFLQDWAPLQPMCDAFDEALQGRGLLERGVQPFGAWALQQTLDAMGLFLRLGFELELYAPCEFQMVCWYEDCVCGMRLQLHDAVQRSAQAQQQAHEAAQGAKKANKKKAAKPLKPQPPGSAATRAELQLLVVRRDLCRAVALLIAALERQKLLVFAPLMFMPLATRFERRFQVFHSLHRPTPLPLAHYEHLCETQLHVTPPDELRKSAAAFLKQAKTSLDQALQQPAAPLGEAQQAELKQLMRVCVANTVFIASLPAEPPPGATAKMSFSANRHFPVFSLETPKPKPSA